MNEFKIDFIENIAAHLLECSNVSFEVALFIGCQFALESNFGTSELSTIHSNYCGMKNPLVRLSCALHAGDSMYKFASYDSIDHCVFDYVLCLQYHKPLRKDYRSVEHFKKFIASFYCPEKDYISRIVSIYNQYLKFKENERK